MEKKIGGKFSELAPEYFLNKGYSCSESFARVAVELGLADEDIISIATSFSGGMGSGCLCGAVAGAQMIIGLLHGKTKDNQARALAREFYQKFIEIHKVTCCKVLTKNFDDFHSKERKEHCANMVYDSAKILDEILEKARQSV
ncbi:MAG: C_GCAxxG_C_C family protein [Candidatus Gastranaerophilales bacterium]|nr:C_GCAxxG_C_C family protein [Candidatus Gastranaerophilales bacterium]